MYGKVNVSVSKCFCIILTICFSYRFKLIIVALRVYPLAWILSTVNIADKSPASRDALVLAQMGSCAKKTVAVKLRRTQNFTRSVRQEIFCLSGRFLRTGLVM